MAYKFQLGAAVLSGSIKADDGIVATAVDATTADNVVSSLGNADIPSAKVALADGSVLIGDSNGHATARSLSGDIAVNNAGAVTIQANAVEGSMINSNAAGDALAYSSNALNVQVSGALKVAGDKIGITGSFAGAGLVGLGGADAASSIAIDIGGLPALGGATVAQTDEFLFDDAGTLKKLQFTNLEDSIFGNISSDVLVAAGGAATIQADAVTYAKIQNVSATNRILGRDSAGAGIVEEISPANLRTMINVEDGSTADQTAVEIIGLLNSDLGGAFTIGSQADDLATFKGPVTIEGNLTVLGSSVEIDAGFVVTSSVKFEGTTPDGNETELIATNPTADRTITLPDLSGHVPLIAGAATAGSIAVTAAEFALLDGGSTIGTTALNKDDGFMHNDNGTMKHTKIEKIGDFLAGSALASVSGQLALDIGGLAAYETTIAQTDEFVFDDAGTLKKVQFTHLEDSVFASVSGDATVAAGGALTIAATSVENGMLAGSIADSKLNQIATAGKVALSALEIDGESNAVTTLADADLFIVDDGAGGSNKKMTASVLKSYVSDAAADVQNVAAAGTLVVGINYFSDMSSDGEDAVALPASPSPGQAVKVKAPSDCSEARYITINRAGSQTIDGATSIRLESPFAAVELVYVANDLWRVF